MYDEQKINVMVDGAYNKLKSFYYYDKTLLFIKKEIALFETDKDFEYRMDVLKKNLYEENEEYFDKLILEMGNIVLPKKMRFANNDSSIVKSDIDYKKEINKINFFIKLPLELYIVDTLWMLIIGKIAKDVLGESKYSYAGKFKKSVFINGIEDIFQGIDFASNRCFEPYFIFYNKWRDDALKSVKKNNDKNTLIIGMDLKGFYYSVQFDFRKLEKYLKYDSRLKEIVFLTKVIEKIYHNYTKQIGDYRLGISLKDHVSILPIGLLSSNVIREIYIKEFDNQIIKKIHPLHYGRYVDDILLVIEDDEKKIYEDSNYYINKFLIKNNLFFEDGLEIKSITYPEIVIQKEKTSLFYFEKNKTNILIEAYYEQIDQVSSEANLMPDMDLLKSSFYSKAYHVKTEGESKRIRDIKILEGNNYNVTKYINGLKRTLKNTAINNAEIASYLEQILYFYKGSVAIEHMSSWSSLFELLVMCSEKKKANDFYLSIKSFITQINCECADIDDIKDSRKGEIVEKLKICMKEQLVTALSLAAGLDYSCIRSGSTNVLNMAKKFRKSNLINHQMVCLPLINYTLSPILEKDSILFNISKADIMNNSDWKREYSLNPFKIKWSPRFIHLNEIYLWYFFCYFTQKNTPRILYTDIYRQYLDDNNLSYSFKNPVIESKSFENNKTFIDEAEIINEKREKVRVGIVNTWITEDDALNALGDVDKNLSLDKKKAMYKVLNSAVEEKVNYIVFPEYYLPYLWLDDVMKYAKQNNITIISGLQYLTYQQHAYNITIVAAGTKNIRGFKNSILAYREKNFYAPLEKVYLAQKGYTCEDASQPFYFILKNGDVKLSIMLCYEFTDIDSRTAMKSYINFLFVPQMNPDTHYFSSIVESTARDLYAFVIQANTSKYGDSRITMPAKSDYREIVQVKGGINDAVLVGEINLGEFDTYKNKYLHLLCETINTCLKCEFRNCTNCKKVEQYKHKVYKGLPPRYNGTQGSGTGVSQI